jgi:glycosyltransferase involved in cell wall biosynthesis
MARQYKIGIHQFHSGSAVADAITNGMFFVRSVLRSFGFTSDIFVEHLDPALSGQIRKLEDLEVTESDLLLIHHSMGHNVFSRLADLRCRKALVYHNITSPQFFDEDDPFHAYAIKGYSQLSLFRDIVESAIAVSPFNARQLSRRGFDKVAVIPLLRDFAAIRAAPHAKRPYYDEAAVFRLLFVGRIVPHKCQHELIDFVDQIRSIGRIPLELVLVGPFDEGDRYKLQLDELVRRSPLDRQVQIIGRVTDEELFGWYRAASAYVSLSEHEGFGVPLIEAMAFDLPVVAYPSSAVPDTLGEAGITLPDKNPASILEPLIRLYEDRSFKGEVLRSQRRRLLRFSRSQIERELRAWLIGAGAYEDDAQAPGGASQIDDESHPSGRTHYVIEGPFETSYSLAVVNRNIALALGEKEGRSSCIEPADGTEDYAVNAIAAANLPQEIRKLVGAAASTTERLVTIRNTYPPRPNGMLGDVRLLHLAWEESAIPNALADLINLHLDGVLAPSEYSKRAIRDSGVRVPIAVIGHGIDHSGVRPRMIGERAKRGPVTQSLPFTFLHISSGLARKGIEELITAYCLAFSSRDPVLLVIKTFDNSDNTVEAWVERLTGASKYSPAIQIISEELDQREIDFLYHVSDAVVLPSRGEGFNLPAAEAMARGLPVIVTRHSGHLDFCNDENSWLIDCTCEFSTNHLKIANSYWARPSVDQLVETMKSVYRAGRPPDAATACRAAQGQRDALQLRWRDVAKRVDEFVEYLDNRPVMRRKLRLAWISTYNARCGIAAYSAHLLEFFDENAFDITIFADDQEAVGPDPDNLLRLWSKFGGSLTRVRNHLLANGFDAAFFQHNFSFFDFDDFAETLAALSDAGISTFVTFHRTKELVAHRRMAEALQSCTRVFVHSLEDVNRLHEFGAGANLALLPHAAIDRAAPNAGVVRSLLGLSGFGPVIGTFGFLLPGKGLPELIHAFALILRAYPAAYLLMLNADYPAPESQQERDRCLALLRLLELEGRVRLINEFLEIEETLFLLSACDVVIFPYQRSEESASGAVRLGLAAGRPVLTTPLPVFADLSEVVERLPGTDALAITEGILSVLGDDHRRAEILRRQRAWVRANSWATQAARLSNIILGCFEEAHRVELRVPTALAPATERAGTWREKDLAAARRFRERSQLSADNGAVATEALAEFPDSPTLTQPVRKRPGLLSGLGVQAPRTAPPSGDKASISRADRARDARDWATAARYYRKALDRNPDNPPIWVQYGHALKEAGSLSEAESAYRKSLELDGNVADTHLQLGHALKIQGRKIEASVAYLRALTLDPALEHAAAELKALGWTTGRIRLALRRESGAYR